MNVILEGIVGSHAYGLDRESSDIDTLGIYVAPFDSVIGLNPPNGNNDTVVHRDPDTTHHELLKFCRLALKCNPTITELLWLGDYTKRSTSGIRLVSHATSFLSAPYVRNAYLGYATQQFHRIQVRESHDFSSDTKNRTAKHARHLLRLLDQGLQLWKWGELEVRVADPQRYFDFGDRVQAGDTQLAQHELYLAECEFNLEPSCLPDSPNTEVIDTLVRHIRLHQDDGPSIMVA